MDYLANIVHFFNGFDFTLVVIIGICLLWGFKRGVFSEALAIVLWVIAFFLATMYSSLLDGQLSHSIGQGKGLGLLGYVLIFLLLLLLGGVLNYVCSMFFKGEKSFSNHIIGAGLGVVRGALIAFIIVFAILNTTGINQRMWVKDSQITSWLRQPVAAVTRQFLRYKGRHF